MNVTDWKLKMKEALKIHASEINGYYKSHHKIPMSIIKNNPRSKKLLLPAEEVHHSNTLNTKIYKRNDERCIVSHIITGEGKYFSFNTKLKYFPTDVVFIQQSIEKNSGIILSNENSTRGCIIGGSPTFKYGTGTPRIYWEDILDKDEHFNQSLQEKLLSYDTYLVMREIYPFVPVGTQLLVKELFDE